MGNEEELREIWRNFDRHHPHDHFFRYAFGQVELASALFQRLLPPALQIFVEDPARLTLQDASFVAEALRGSQSDLLWRCDGAGTEDATAYIYVLFEHQSRPDPNMAARLLFYLVRIWERHLSESGDSGVGRARLPLIFPLVLYQGAEPWNSPLRLIELVDLPGGEAAAAGLRQYVPDFGYAVQSLRETELADVDPGELRLVLSAMKLALATPAAQRVSLILQEGENLPESLRSDRIVRVALLYLFATTRPEERIAMVEEIQQSRSKRSEEVRSVADLLILEGREEGIQQGLQQGREEGLWLALERLVATGMSEQEAREKLGLN